jgi:hypothetical protein
MTRELLYGRPDAPGLAEHLTVFGPGVTNMNTASPVVLRALGFAPAEVDFIVSRRPWASPTEIPGPFQRRRPQTRTEIFRIEAWAGGATPSGRVLTAVVERQGGIGQTPGGIGQTPGGIGQTPGGTGQTPARTRQTPGGIGQTPAGTGQTPARTGQTPARTGQTPGGTGQTPAGIGQTPAGIEQTPGGTGQTPGGIGRTPAVTLGWRWSEASRPAAPTPATVPGTGGRSKRP